MFTPTTLCQKNTIEGCVRYRCSELGAIFLYFKRSCGTNQFNLLGWLTTLFKIFTDNNVNWCRIDLDCQEAPTQRGQTWRKVWPNMGVYLGDFRFGRTLNQNHQNPGVSETILETWQVC